MHNSPLARCHRKTVLRDTAMALDVAVVSEYSLEYYISNIIAFERRRCWCKMIFVVICIPCRQLGMYLSCPVLLTLPPLYPIYLTHDLSPQGSMGSKVIVHFLFRNMFCFQATCMSVQQAIDHIRYWCSH